MLRVYLSTSPEASLLSQKPAVGALRYSYFPWLACANQGERGQEYVECGIVRLLPFIEALYGPIDSVPFANPTRL